MSGRDYVLGGEALTLSARSSATRMGWGQKPSPPMPPDVASSPFDVAIELAAAHPTLAALLAAAFHGKVAVVSLLFRVAPYADVNCTDHLGWNPVMLACMQGHLEVLEELLAHSPDKNTVLRDGRSALHIAVEYWQPDCVKVLLDDGVYVNTSTLSKGITPLIVAILRAPPCGDISVIEKLLAHGALPEMCDSNGFTAVMYASRWTR